MKSKLILTLVLLAIAVVAGYFYFSKSNSTFHGDDTAFAVENIDDLTRVFIATEHGATADLTLENGVWYINGKHEAQSFSMDMLLNSLKDLQVEAPVPAKAKENMLRSLAVRNKKVELYKNNEETPYKTIYVGEASQMLNGNLCLLETRKNGRAENPYYVGKKGHRGIIAPIFFVKETDWMSTRVFAHQPKQITSVEVSYPQMSEQSFAIEKSGDNVALLNPVSGEKIPQSKVNRLAVDQYLKQFAKIHFETLDLDLTKNQRDSILNSTPRATISLTSTGQKTTTIELYQKEGIQRNVEYKAIGKGEDLDYFYGNYEGKFVLCQRYVFDKLLYGRDNFLLTKR